VRSPCPTPRIRRSTSLRPRGRPASPRSRSDCLPCFPPPVGALGSSGPSAVRRTARTITSSSCFSLTIRWAWTTPTASASPTTRSTQIPMPRWPPSSIGSMWCSSSATPFSLSDRTTPTSATRPSSPSTPASRRTSHARWCWRCGPTAVRRRRCGGWPSMLSPRSRRRTRPPLRSSSTASSPGTAPRRGWQWTGWVPVSGWYPKIQC